MKLRACGDERYIFVQDGIPCTSPSFYSFLDLTSYSTLYTMELDIPLENTHFDQQCESTITNDILTRLATKHNAHAYNQCPQCLSASQAPLPGPLTRNQPMPHPSNCKACRTLLKAELTTVEQELRNLNANLNFLDQAPFTRTGEGAEIASESNFLVERRRVLKEQCREPCSYSIPLQPYMVFKQSQYRALQVDRLDPRYHPHQHQGTTCNFGGEFGSPQWEGANRVLRKGLTVMPGLSQQKAIVKPVWQMEQDLERQRAAQASKP
ncbi:MAG: hypothetical protein LQ339_004452 [Xanthoria mediterranea]|nr:MAG: hypothetical protein LQ339_004452 [Xanthoria mediterranea]